MDAVSKQQESRKQEKIRFATVWLSGCSGCHMSFLDLDEWLFDLAALANIAFSPVADVKEYPEGVDVCLVEGGIANEDNLAMAYKVRSRTKLVVAFGDCAVTANVPAMRNWLGDLNAHQVLTRSYLELADVSPQLPDAPGIVPPLRDRVVPLHEVIPVDVYLPGCPPDATRIRAVLEALLRGEMPGMAGREMLKFG